MGNKSGQTVKMNVDSLADATIQARANQAAMQDYIKSIKADIVELNESEIMNAGAISRNLQDANEEMSKALAKAEKIIEKISEFLDKLTTSTQDQLTATGSTRNLMAEASDINSKMKFSK